MEAVVRDARRPVPGGFEELFWSEYPVVVRIATTALQDAHLAEDVAQDAMLALGHRFADLGRTDDAVAWVRTAAADLALHALRDRRRLERRHRRFRAKHEQRSPEERVVEREDVTRVRAALSRLSPRAATVLVLRHSGLGHGEVAEAMGVRIGAVGTMLRRAEAALCKEVDKDAPRS